MSDRYREREVVLRHTAPTRSAYGTSQRAIARNESGNYRNVSVTFIRRLADALNAETEMRLRRRGA